MSENFRSHSGCNRKPWVWEDERSTCNQCWEEEHHHHGCEHVPVEATAVVPYASGTPVEITTQASGIAGYPAFVGFGNNAQGDYNFNTTLSLVGAPDLNENYAFVVPHDGLLKSLYAFFSVTETENVVTGTYTVYAQLFRSRASNSNAFDAIAQTNIALSPSFTGPNITLGSTATGHANFSVPVTAGERLLLTFRVVSTATTAATLYGYASAGLAIKFI